MAEQRQHLDEEEYSVVVYYHTSGICQLIARSDTFSNLTLAVISLNAVYLGIDADHNTGTSYYNTHVFFIAMDLAFFVFFLFEWGVRFGSFAD